MLEPDEVDALVTLYESGVGLRELGRQFGMHRHTARGHLIRQGLELRDEPPALTSDQVVESARLYAAGWSTYRLGERYGASPQAVRQALLRQGVRLRPRGHAAD